MRTSTIHLRPLAIVLVCLAALGGGGCRGWDPFACLDRCTLADWTNRYSCVSCCPPGGATPAAGDVPLQGECSNCR